MTRRFLLQVLASLPFAKFARKSDASTKPSSRPELTACTEHISDPDVNDYGDVVIRIDNIAKIHPSQIPPDSELRFGAMPSKDRRCTLKKGDRYVVFANGIRRRIGVCDLEYASHHFMDFKIDVAILEDGIRRFYVNFPDSAPHRVRQTGVQG